MGRGPKPTPNDFRPLKSTTLPEPPSDFPDEFRDMWDEIIPRLADHVALSEIDSDALADLVTCRMRISQCEGALNRDGLTVIGQKGNEVKHPMVTIVRQYRDHLQRWFCQFGLTAAARKNLTGPKKETKSPLELAREKLRDDATTTVQ